ncbi:MAG: LysM peptidoglycan-binding domain-containing protein [Actinobacteria bacterium]|nr:LysM peptidoglycan-binding domain-containing protein [Actinomycetota bacterium]MBW3642671.1 LysM peptidoglycan-binding domain-containing protein [Actinomycetota bacterium]
MAAVQYAEVEDGRRGGSTERALGPASPRRRCSGPPAIAHRSDGLRPGLALLVVVLLALAGPWIAGDVQVGGPGGPPGSSRPAPRAELGLVATTGGALVHLVQPGESYWSLAVALQGDGGGDPRPLVHALVRANGGRSLRAGDSLVVPPGLLEPGAGPASRGAPSSR